jgi:hypothetical protein
MMFETETKVVSSLENEYQIIFSGKFESNEQLDVVWIKNENEAGNKARLYITKNQFLK